MVNNPNKNQNSGGARNQKKEGSIRSLITITQMEMVTLIIMQNKIETNTHSEVWHVE